MRSNTIGDIKQIASNTISSLEEALRSNSEISEDEIISTIKEHFARIFLETPRDNYKTLHRQLMDEIHPDKIQTKHPDLYQLLNEHSLLTEICEQLNQGKEDFEQHNQSEEDFEQHSQSEEERNSLINLIENFLDHSFFTTYKRYPHPIQDIFYYLLTLAKGVLLVAALGFLIGWALVCWILAKTQEYGINFILNQVDSDNSSTSFLWKSLQWGVTAFVILYVIAVQCCNVIAQGLFLLECATLILTYVGITAVFNLPLYAFDAGLYLFNKLTGRTHHLGENLLALTHEPNEPDTPTRIFTIIGNARTANYPHGTPEADEAEVTCALDASAQVRTEEAVVGINVAVSEQSEITGPTPRSTF